jgi:hypothetical protein
MDVDQPFASSSEPSSSSSSIQSALHSIQSQLSAICPRATPASLHQLQPFDFDGCSDSVLSSLFQIRQAISSFSASVPTLAPKQIVLLREWAFNEDASLSTSRVENLAQTCLSKRKAVFPLLSSAVRRKETSLEKTVALLEDVGKSLGLEVFKDEVPGAGGVNLTMAGKVLVIDLEVEGTKGRVTKVRFAYGQETKGNASVDQLLSDELGALDWDSGQGPDEEKLDRFRDHVAALVRLDERMAKAEGAAADHFEDSKALTDVFQQIHQAEACVSSYNFFG